MTSVYGSADSSAAQALSRVTLEDDLAGDGNKDSGIRVDKDIDVSQGYYDENKDETQADTDQVISNVKVDQTAKIGQVTRTEAPQDAVTATIGAGSTVSAGNDIKVTADDTLTVDMIAGTVNQNGLTGVGIGVSALVSYSDIRAAVEEGAVLTAGGNIDVSASSRSVKNDDPSVQGSQIGGLIKSITQNNDDDVTDYGLRVIAETGAVREAAGVAVPVAVLSMESSVSAVMGGTITEANNVNVSSATNYENSVAATLAVAGSGAAGVGTPVSVVRSAGNATSAITGNSVSARGNVRVTGDHKLGGLSIAVPLSAGQADVNVAVPVTINRLHAETYIVDGTDVNANDVTVHTDANTSARSLELGAAGGLVAIGIGVSAVIDEPTVYTYIGMSPKLLEEEGADLSNVENGKVTVNGDIEVSHTVRSNATPEMLVPW